MFVINLVGSIKKLSVFILGVCLLSFTFYFDDVVFIDFLFLLYVLAVAFFCSGPFLTDPRGLFLLIFYVYSVFFSLQVIFVGYTKFGIDLEYLAASLRIQFFSAIVMVTVFNLIIKDDSFFRNKSKVIFERYREFTFLKNSEVLYFLFIAPLIFYGFYLILESGASSKREYLDSATKVQAFAYFASVIMIAVFGIRLVKIPIFRFDFLIFTIFCTGLMFLLFNGERDVLFKLVLVYLIVFFDKKRFPVLFPSFLIILFAIFIVPSSQYFKSFFLNGEINFSRVGLDLLFSNEFTSAGKNLYSLVYFGVEQKFSFFYSDIMRAFTPSFFFSEIDVQSSGAWFNNTFRVVNDFSGTSGWGFTIVGNGYLVGGYSGVFCIMTIYAFVLSVFYNIRFKNIYLYVFYLLLFLVAIYVIRADLANYFSQAFKISGLVVVTIYFADCFLVKSSKRLSYER